MKRVVRFGDTDAAGVIHFVQCLRWCHESWEESLDLFGVSALEVFPSINQSGKDPEVLMPIVHCEADFLMPLTVGDRLLVKIFPEKIDSGSFQVQSKFLKEGNEAAVALTRHVSLNALTKKRCNLPNNIDEWIGSSIMES